MSSARQNSNIFFQTLFICIFFLKTSHSASPIPNINLATALVPDKTGFTMTGNAASDQFGWVVRKAGDVNGDGYDDIIIGAYNKASQQGEVYVVYGKPGTSLTDFTIGPSTLIPSSTGFTISGNAAGDYFGYSVGSAGDVDKDGYDDIIIGAYKKNTYKGIAYVIYGKPNASAANIALTTELDPIFTGFAVTGNAINDYFAWSVNTAGDVNKDGYSDIIIGAYQKNGVKGAAYVIFGHPRASLQDIDLALTSLNPSLTGFLITGNANNDNFGITVGPAGDVNGDGRDDIIVGASGKDSSRGAVYIIYGQETFSQAVIDLSTNLDPLTTGFVITGQTAGDQFGAAISPVGGDFNKDGYDDIIVGAYARDSYKGMAYVIYGKPTASMGDILLSTVTLNPTQTGFSIAGTAANVYFGFAVSFAGDMNGDGYDDIVIGAQRVGNFKGESYVIYGAEKSSMPTITLATLDPATTGFTITGNADNDRFGYSVSTAGDFNKDGYADIVIGAYGKASNKGVTYLIHASCVTSTASPCTTRSFCQSCDSTYSASNPQCQGCPANCQQYSGPDSCQTCGSGYFVSNSQCSQCIQNCQLCTDSSTCGTCDANYLYYQSQCIQNCPSTKYPSAGTCASCFSDCAVCTSNSDCQTCVEGYFKSSATQCSSCIANCKQCSDSSSCDLCVTGYGYFQSQCVPCPSGTYLSGGTCSSCIANCQQCTGSSTCNLCEAGYGYFQSQCVSCPSGTYLSGGTCSNCLLNCDFCTGGTSCILCVSGYFFSGTQCSQCMPNCQECTGSSSCLLCDTNYLYYQSQCIQNCPATTYPSGSTCLDCSLNCAVCSSNSNCQTCDQGYFKAGPSQCTQCIQNCQQCSDATSCDTCDINYLYYQSQCIQNCPLAKYPSTGTCHDCLQNCKTCTSGTDCQVCDSGYTLSNSECVLSAPKNETASAAPQTIASTFTAVGSVVCVGSSTFLSTRLISEVVQNMRYINLIVPQDLTEMYQSWETDLINWELPNALSNINQFKPLPTLFSQYGLEPAFLENFWSNLMTIVIGLGAFFTCLVLLKLLHQAKSDQKWVFSILQSLKAGALNFTIAQTYESLHDTLFFFVLDIKTNPRNSFFAWICLFSGILFVGIGAFLVFSNLFLVHKYQRLKKEGQAKNDMTAFEAFNEKNKSFELFYSDFDDTDALSHSFLAILTVRSGISAIIVTSLYENTVVQMILLILMDIAMLFFLIIKRPLLTLRATLTQYFCEIVALFVHACVFMLGMQNNREETPNNFKDTVSTTLRYLNTALIAGTTGFMLFEIFKTIYDRIKAWRAKKKQNLSVQPSASDNSIIQQNLSSQTINQTIFIQQHFNININQSQIRMNNQSDFSSELHLPSHENKNFAGFNLEPSQNFNSSMDIIMDNSFIRQTETNNWVNQQRDQILETNLTRRKLRIKMRNRLPGMTRNELNVNF